METSTSLSNHPALLLVGNLNRLLGSAPKNFNLDYTYVYPSYLKMVKKAPLIYKPISFIGGKITDISKDLKVTLVRNVSGSKEKEEDITKFDLEDLVDIMTPEQAEDIYEQVSLRVAFGILRTEFNRGLHNWASVRSSRKKLAKHNVVRAALRRTGKLIGAHVSMIV
jgi:hypothetical protein